MKLILLAAGKNSRIYRKLGKHKCLLKIKNKTLIEKIINGARSCGLKKIDIIVGFKKENIMSYFKIINITIRMKCFILLFLDLKAQMKI